MGIFDEYKAQFKRPNNALIQLILINVTVFVVTALLVVITPSFGNLISSFLILPRPIEVFIYKPWTLLTYSFMHGDLGHIFFNMLGLYFFGRVISDLLGSKRLVSVYILGAIAGAVTFLIAYNLISYYSHQFTGGMVGASAAIYAIIVAAAFTAPEYEFHLFMMFRVKLKYIALFYVFISLLSIKGNNAGGNLAHLGGALIGYIYIKSLRRGIDMGKPIEQFLSFFTDFKPPKIMFKPKPKMKVSKNDRGTSSNTSVSNKKASQEEIDRILDKINDSGYESLTKEEKAKLFSS